MHTGFVKYFFPLYLLMFMAPRSVLSHRPESGFSVLPSLPDTKGFAGMYAGVSNQVLFCMGGTNFPGKTPDEGGKKMWYDDIYMLKPGGNWKKIVAKLPSAMAHGVSATYKNEIFLAGGCSHDGHISSVYGFRWENDSAIIRAYPDLPVPLANMSGAITGNLLILAGGNSSPGGVALRKCFGLDLEQRSGGWLELPAWPGPERILPACTGFAGKFYLFSGERKAINANKNPYRQILQDAFCFTASVKNGKWSGSWSRLRMMPKGFSAVGNPLPVIDQQAILFWGGIDPVTALHKGSENHPGIPEEILLYFPETDHWKLFGKTSGFPPRVTLPVVYWNHQWVYVNGETRPGIRTNTVIGISLNHFV